MVKRTRAKVFWRVLIIVVILAVVGGLAFITTQFASGAWQLFATITPTATFTPTEIIPTATLYVPSDTPTATLTATRSGPVDYTVKAGDNLSAIATTYGVEVQALMAYNNLTSSALTVGQKLVIPPPGYTVVIPTATPIPTNLKPGTYIDYTIQPGDVLGALAEKFGTRVDDILIVNQMTDPNNIQVGEVIHIPYHSLTGTPITPTRTPRPSATRRPTATKKP